MTIEEAIKHAEEIAKNNELKAMCVEEAYQTAEQSDCEKCAAEHRQLAEWLKDYKRLLERQPCEDAVSREAVSTSIKEMKKWINSGNRGNCDYFIVDKIEEIIYKLDIDNLPSVTPARPVGNW